MVAWRTSDGTVVRTGYRAYDAVVAAAVRPVGRLNNSSATTVCDRRDDGLRGATGARSDGPQLLFDVGPVARRGSCSESSSSTRDNTAIHHPTHLRSSAAYSPNHRCGTVHLSCTGKQVFKCKLGAEEPYVVCRFSATQSLSHYKLTRKSCHAYDTTKQVAQLS